MRKILTGATVMLAAAMMAPFASADTTTVGLHAGSHDYDGEDLDFYGLNGGWNHDFGNNWVVQADGQIDRLDVGLGDIGQSYGSVAVGMRNDSWSAYGFVGLNDAVVSGTNMGVGGQIYLGSFVINADYGHLEVDDLDGSLDQFNVGATWFVMPDFGVSAEIGTGQVELFGSDADMESYAVGALWRFSGSPVSISGRWQHDELDVPGSFEVDTWTLGVNLNFGTDTAQEQVTQGASWDGARSLYERQLLLLP